jgi:acetyl esterase/lipase
MTREPETPNIDRRSAIGLSALALAALPLRAHAETAAAPASETIDLWPSGPPGSEGTVLTLQTTDAGTGSGVPDRALSSIARPTMTVFRPVKSDGSALLIVPGGSYAFESVDSEGTEPALRFARSGTTAFVLTYRLPSEGWKNSAEVPLQDAQRAIRLIRTMGPSRFDIAPDRVGVLGFSAGGHLAAMLATKFINRTYAPVDEADKADARPTFAALLYPVITMRTPFAHEGSVEKLLGANAPLKLRESWSAESLVVADTPPCFLCAATDDPVVPIDNTLMMFASLRAAKVAAEMHIFEKGGHGFGLDMPEGLPVSAWPDLLQRWCIDRGYFRQA